MSSKYIYNKTYFNEELGVHKVIRAQTQWEFNIKYNKMLSDWAIKEANIKKRELIQDMQNYVEDINLERMNEINQYKDILKFTLTVNDNIDWNKQYKKDKFKEFKFNKVRPNLNTIVNELNVPKKSFLEKIFKGIEKKRLQKEERSKDIFKERLNDYVKEKESFFNEYEKEKQIFEEEKRLFNENINNWKKEFESGKKDAVEKYIRVVLENSKYPDSFEKEYDVEYKYKEKVLLVSYDMPNTEKISNIESYRYVKSTNSIKEIQMKKKEYEDFYENIIFQITLRTIHEIFESTSATQVDMVIFNGWVDGTDKATGRNFNNCVISLQVTRKQFEEIELSKIDFKECTRNLKGIFAGKLVLLNPVKPIMDMNREDSRFIESKEIIESIDSSTNLAEMPWEDFEHLIREVFSKYFSKQDSDIKVTQSSRDGGVDAIAFDSDHIRGGKFVIQAKRYNNVVPVSAVRDLYGTMINEGAVKGILVTTSYFGTDSLNFVKDKPISLIDGSNLVYMMKEQGYEARIELKR